MDFAALPPEINSGLIYAGPGSGPLLAAAGAWDGLASELATAASGYGSVISELTDSPWIGPSSRAMLSAITPFVAWLSSLSDLAEQTASPDQVMEMWAQDAGTMYGYAASSATASTLSPFDAPPNTTTPDAETNQAQA